MKIKVDENIGRSGVNLLRQAGHDVMTVPEEGLSGSADDAVLRACVSERRTLVTLDRDFGQVPRFLHGAVRALLSSSLARRRQSPLFKAACAIS